MLYLALVQCLMYVLPTASPSNARIYFCHHCGDKIGDLKPYSKSSWTSFKMSVNLICEARKCIRNAYFKFFSIRVFKSFVPLLFQLFEILYYLQLKVRYLHELFVALSLQTIYRYCISGRAAFKLIVNVAQAVLVAFSSFSPNFWPCFPLIKRL